MHAATKPQVLGLFLVLVGIALILRKGTATWVLLLVAVGQMLTAPVAAHMIGRASYRTGLVPKSEFTVDELTRDIEDRKSTRLNSSHVAISYAVFCLKKKTKR